LTGGSSYSVRARPRWFHADEARLWLAAPIHGRSMFHDAELLIE
jgi:hypothetical protein